MDTLGAVFITCCILLILMRLPDDKREKAAYWIAVSLSILLLAMLFGITLLI